MLSLTPMEHGTSSRNRTYILALTERCPTVERQKYARKVLAGVILLTPPGITFEASLLL